MTMPEEYHYSVLGLAPGATDEEIRTAYRRLVKIYHPDRDSSLDAEMKYREIQAAYSALRGHRAFGDNGRSAGGVGGSQKAEPGGKADKAGKDNRKSKGKKYSGWRGFNRARDFLIDDEIPYSPRIPFSLRKLKLILWSSLKESIGFGLVVRTCLCVRVLWILFRAPVLPQLAGVVTIPCLLTGCLIFRYYNVKAAKRRFFLIASVGSAIAVSLCYAWFTLPQSRRLEVGNVFFVTLVSLMVLWVKVKFDFPAFPRTKGRCQR